MTTESGELAETSAGCLRADMRLRLACRRDLLAVNCKSTMTEVSEHGSDLVANIAPCSAQLSCAKLQYNRSS